MFNLFRKRNYEVEESEHTEVIAANSQTIEEVMGLKEYVSFDSVKAHLVDVLEENRRLKEREQTEKETDRKKLETMRKEKELALIEADEWKKRTKEKEEEIKKLKITINDNDSTIEKLTSERNNLITKQEMTEEKLRIMTEKREEADSAAKSLREALKHYFPRDWEKTTKTALVATLKKIMEE